MATRGHSGDEIAIAPAAAAIAMPTIPSTAAGRPLRSATAPHAMRPTMPAVVATASIRPASTSV